MIAIIGGIIAYTLRERGKMRRNIDEDQNSIIGSNPEPSKKSNYGRWKQCNFIKVPKYG